jgi:hypothetical protein
MLVCVLPANCSPRGLPMLRCLGRAKVDQPVGEECVNLYGMKVKGKILMSTRFPSGNLRALFNSFRLSSKGFIVD